MKVVLEDIPWGMKHSQIFYDRAKGVHVYKGSVIVPPELRPFRSKDFSLARWTEDELNGTVSPPEKAPNVFVPKKHQREAAIKIRQAYNAGWSGFLLADKTGVGKTLSALLGITVVAKEQGFAPGNKAKVLIVCPKGVIPQWRHTLHSYPTSSSLLRPMVINYQQLRKLIIAPAENRIGKKAKTRHKNIAVKGKPSIDWDFIVFDEAHYLKNFPSSEASLAAVTLAKLDRNYMKGRSPFTIFSTATPGATPLNFSVMANFMAPLLSAKPEAKKITPGSWGEFLLQEGFAVKKGKVSWTWATNPWFGKNSDDPKERAKYAAAARETKLKQRRDAQRIGKALTKPAAPFLMRSPSDLEGWPEQQLIPLPIEMTAKQRPIYEEAWSTFRNWLRLTPAKSDPKGALVEMLRYRQKTSLLKVEPVSEQIIDWVGAGNQVYVSCEFVETMERYREHLEKAKIKVVELSGRTSATREEERIAFQKGKADVVLCSVVAGISLHAKESLPDGTQATARPRITVLSDVRQNNLDSTQALGRAHRDGENSICYIPYLEDTVDKRVIDSFVNKQTNMHTMTGASVGDAEELERLFREAAARRSAT